MLSPPAIPPAYETRAAVHAAKHRLGARGPVRWDDGAPGYSRHMARRPDSEGAVLLTPHTLILVSPNDFGVEGVATEFWRIIIDVPIA